MVHLSFTPKKIAKDLNFLFLHFNLSPRRGTSSKLLSSHRIDSYPSLHLLLALFQERKSDLFGEMDDTLVFLTTFLYWIQSLCLLCSFVSMYKLNEVILWSGLQALSRLERQDFTFFFFFHFLITEPVVQLIALRYAKIIFIHQFFLANVSLDFISRKKNVPCVFFSFTINKVHTLILIWLLYG